MLSGIFRKLPKTSSQPEVVNLTPPFAAIICRARHFRHWEQRRWMQPTENETPSTSKPSSDFLALYFGTRAYEKDKLRSRFSLESLSTNSASGMVPKSS